jgi:hypothetical protein
MVRRWLSMNDGSSKVYPSKQAGRSRRSNVSTREIRRGMTSTGGRAHQQGIPKWAVDLMARGRDQGYVWDADIVEQQPRMINTPILDEWIARFEAKAIEVRESVIRIPEEVRRSWIRARRRALEVHVTTWTPRNAGGC